MGDRREGRQLFGHPTQAGNAVPGGQVRVWPRGARGGGTQARGGGTQEVLGAEVLGAPILKDREQQDMDAIKRTLDGIIWVVERRSQSQVRGAKEPYMARKSALFCAQRSPSNTRRCRPEARMLVQTRVSRTRGTRAGVCLTRARTGGGR